MTQAHAVPLRAVAFGDDFFRAVCYGIHALRGSPPLLSYSRPGPILSPLSPKLYQDSPDHPPLLTHRRPTHPHLRWVRSRSVPTA